jgi:multidrug efflux pump subunit AcrB
MPDGSHGKQFIVKASFLKHGDDEPTFSMPLTTEANAVTLSDAVLETIREMESKYQSDSLQFTVAANSSEFTKEATRSVIKDLFLAILLVVATMLLFLHSIRNAVIVSVSIPASLIATFTVIIPVGIFAQSDDLTGFDTGCRDFGG